MGAYYSNGLRLWGHLPVWYGSGGMYPFVSLSHESQSNGSFDR